MALIVSACVKQRFAKLVTERPSQVRSAESKKVRQRHKCHETEFRVWGRGHGSVIEPAEDPVAAARITEAIAAGKMVWSPGEFEERQCEMLPNVVAEQPVQMAFKDTPGPGGEQDWAWVVGAGRVA